MPFGARETPQDAVMGETISQRASALIKETKRDPLDRDRLREEWRLLSVKWSAAQDESNRLREMRKVLLDELTLQLVVRGTSLARAEMEARTSEAYKSFIERMHTAMRVAQDLQIEMENADRIYWSHVGHEANQRAEMRMTRG